MTTAKPFAPPLLERIRDRFHTRTRIRYPVLECSLMERQVHCVSNRL